MDDGQIRLRVVEHRASGEAPAPSKVGDGVFACLHCGATLDPAYLKDVGQRGGLGLRMSAVVTESGTGRSKARHYREPSADDRHAALVEAPEGVAEIPIPAKGQGVRVVAYGMTRWADVFTSRQLTLMDVFAQEVAALPEGLRKEGADDEWTTAITTLLGLAVGKLAQYSSTQAGWRQRDSAHAKAEKIFSRNDLPMLWDFAEVYYRSGSVGDWIGLVKSVLSALDYVVGGDGVVKLGDARTVQMGKPGLVATDPPYFDAIGYADLSDFFYIWHRQALGQVHPDLYVTVAAPKKGELTASPMASHGDRAQRRETILLRDSRRRSRTFRIHLGCGLPMIIVYASKEQKAGR